MKKLILFIILIIGISSCKKSGWSQEDQDRFMRDCVAMDSDSKEIEERCKCGLNVMMEKYSSMDEAQEEAQKMNEEELENLLKDCSF